jgi:transforming growth factor-beta-induced protein
MKTLQNFAKPILAVMLFGTFVFATSCESESNMITPVAEEESTQPLKNIVEIASSNSEFSILVEALVKTNLQHAFMGEGSYTVFAPTNEAFKALLNELGILSLNEISSEALVPILMYHVVSGQVLSSDLSTGFANSLTTEQFDPRIYFEVSPEEVLLNGSTRVIAANILASNGVIHVIDKVLLPAAKK